MTVSSILLYGSRARGDHYSDSDTDMLLVTDDERSFHHRIDRLSLSYYPESDLMDRAAKGDLFTCHIALEAKAVYDPDHILERIRGAMKLKKSYATEISRAVDLGWYLALYGSEFENQALAARRVTWVARTILISLSAEAGEPKFSYSDLMKMDRYNDLNLLLEQKNLDHIDEETTGAMEDFLIKRGYRPPIPQGTETDFADHFVRTENQVAIQFLDNRHLLESSYT